MSIIERFITDEFKVKRPKPGFYKLGIYQPGSPETISVNGSLQPLNARELKMVSEGYRLKQWFKFYSDKELLVINTKNLAGADVVEINGETYKVISVEPWVFDNTRYFKSVIYREPQQ